MSVLTHLVSDTFNKFFEPVLELIDHCRQGRDCPALPDLHWIQMGVCRVLGDPKTGRGFLQQLGPHFKIVPSTGLFFEALKSPRRLKLVGELNTLLCRRVRQKLTDPLGRFDELKKFDVFAGDGHWHGAAARDLPKDGRKWAVGHFYMLNMRSHAVSHLEVADEVHRKHEHDMRALKRQNIEDLRQNAPKGRKTIISWDSACLDYAQWDKWKRRGGIYFLTRAKEGAAYDLIEEMEVDRENPMNHGVLVDQKIQPANGGLLRRIECEDPASGNLHVFLTNELSLSPGMLAQIYRMRWDVEKVFDQFKNSLNEQKAWATTATAKTMQAQFLCLAHNLMLLMESHLETRFDLSNTAELTRRAKRLQEMESAAGKAGRQASSMYRHVQRFTKRSLKFIRSLRTYFFIEAPLAHFVAHLRKLYAML